MKRTKTKLVSSIVTLLICFAMLIGSTFAWFTDSASTGVNKIQAGNLDVEVEYSKDGTNWASIERTDSLFSRNLWEPGHTEYVYLKVKNAGSLALKYKVLVTPVSENGGINVYDQNFKLSEYLKFGTTTPSANPITFNNRTEAQNAVTTTVTELTQTNLTSLTQEKTINAGDAEYIALVVYMPENVDNHANAKPGTTAPSIDLGIKVVATQVENESDSFDKNYDADADQDNFYTAGAYYEYFEAVNVTDTADSSGNFTVQKTDTNTGVIAQATGTAEAGSKVNLVVTKTSTPSDNFGITVRAGEELNGYDIKVTGQNTGSLVQGKLYVGTGLENFVFYHNSRAMGFIPYSDTMSLTDEKYSYNPADGYVYFATTTFSPFQATYKAPVAAIGTKVYGSLAEAIKAVPSNGVEPTNIIVLRDVTNAEGMSVAGGKNFVIDFAGHTYELNKPGAGSTNTETNGFQLLAGSTIVMKNGNITISKDNLIAAANGRNIKRIIQNYSKLTLENMTIDGSNQYGGKSHVMSFNNDPVLITGKTNIIAAERVSAFDADGNWGGYERCKVTIDTTGTIVGNIELGQGNIDIKNANVKGGISLCNSCGPEETKDQKSRISITGGTFSSDPSEYLAFGYVADFTSTGYVVSTSSELKINNAYQLIQFAESVNKGNDYAGKTVTLNNDIDLTGKTWVPIGYSSRRNTNGPIFRGTFDGQNHTITNINYTEKNDNMPSGFFGTVEGATISNLVIGGIKQEDGSYVYDEHSSFTGEKDSAAGVVAFVIGSGNTVINNCKNYATISGSAPAGIVSRLYNKDSGSNNIKDCYNYGFINGKNSSESGKAGGIVAITQSNSNSTISNCHNEGKIETYDFNAGGIIGFVNPGCSIEHCTNSNSVSNINTKDSRSVGGIVGWVANTSNVLPVLLNNCNNSGTIKSDGCAGGIAGRICNQTTVNQCTNEGSVSNYSEKTTGYAGGIIGNNDGGTINGCNNTAAVSGVQYSGGVVGYWGFTSNISGSISNCSGGQKSITVINNTNNWAGRIVGCANCVYSSEPFGTISIDDSNEDNYDDGLKTIGLSTFGTLKDVLTVQSGTLHGLPGLRDDSNQSIHTIIFKEGSKLKVDNTTYNFTRSEATCSTTKVNGQWTWDTSSLASN